ncbi:hypothetical protein FRB93_002930 [Tulasnella sp. JGI-2019a]|nr:hypothetical protein FRB93_002930 [Tulasnella sp. JGI-2019a]
MFGPFHGPFPTGKYAICAKDLGLHASSVANNMAVTMAKINQHNHLQIWVLEHGHLGYRIKNEASGNPLSYTPWAIPARLVGKNKHIIVSAESPVEWKLVQTSAADEEPRVFQLRIIADPDLQLADDIALGWNGNLYRVAGVTGTSFEFRGVRTIPRTLPCSLAVQDGTKCPIRSAFYPRIALDHHPSAGGFVVGRNVTNEKSQIWIFEKSELGFQIKNLHTNQYLALEKHRNGPEPRKAAFLGWNVRGVDFVTLQASDGFELGSPTGNWIVGLWNSDVGNNCWITVEMERISGGARTESQWIFTKPPEE